MSCPYCKTDLTDFDDKTLTNVVKSLAKLFTPFGLAKGVYNVGKTIYYDFSNIPNTDKYLYCPVCKLYFIRCCHCGHLNCIGNDIMVSPLKIKCNDCNQEYLYATHPDSDADHGF